MNLDDSSKMESTDKIDIKPAQLKGEENVAEWKASARKALIIMGLWQYVYKPESIVPTPELTEERIEINKTRATVVIQNTLSKVRQRLLNVGWDKESCKPKYY